MNRLKNR